MCGIAGYLLRPGTQVAASDTLRALLDPLRSRGPDDEGVCLIDRSRRRITPCRTPHTVPAATGLRELRDAAGVEPHDAALANARFAIVDLSAGGHQPFTSGDGSVVVVFHGEIYNHVELRSELAARGVRFRTASDTEVLVEGYCMWRDQVWERLNGFWAVALFDGTDGSVVVSRDRFGVAPLYYRDGAAGLYFASSIAPLLDVEPVGAAVDHEAVRGFIATGLKDFDSGTCHASVRSFAPATALRIPLGGCSVAAGKPTVFWRYPERPASVEDVSLDEAVRRFRALFLDAVAVRLRSDVRVAFELSGGLDSSAVVAAAAVQGAAVTTYTLKVPESDEEPYARSMLRRHPLDYRVIEGPEVHFFEDAGDFVRIMEEPFHSPNVYTHYKLRQRMKQDGVHVVLAGSGGDELLAGYESEFWPQARAQLRRDRRRLQALACDLGFRAGSWSRSRETARAALAGVKPKLRSGRSRPAPGSGRIVTPSVAEGLAASYAGLDFQQQRLHHFRVGLLPYYLRSDDHFSMALPMEQRLPFLDHRVVDFGLRMPAAYLFRRGWTKYLLRRAMEPYLPPEIAWRREKMGFPFPLRPFLLRHRTRLDSAIAAVVDAGLAPEPIDYETMLDRHPQRLWRICSTGLWLVRQGGSG